MPTVSKTAVSLRFAGDGLAPERVGEALGCPSDGGVEGGCKPGFWHRRVERRAPGDLDGQISELLAGMSSDPVVWGRLTAAYRADVFCGLFLEEANEGIALSPSTLLALGERNLTLSLDIYDVGG